MRDSLGSCFLAALLGIWLGFAAWSGGDTGATLFACITGGVVFFVLAFLIVLLYCLWNDRL